jgi:hypothetical protein
VLARMRRVCGVLVAGVVLAGSAWSAELPSADRGRLFYENHCVTCHSGKVHRRITPVPITRSELRLIVSAWAKSEQLGWTEAEIADVAEFLDSSYYRSLRP